MLKIFAGNFGNVYRAKYQDQMVAVKELLSPQPEEDDMDIYYQREMAVKAVSWTLFLFDKEKNFFFFLDSERAATSECGEAVGTVQTWRRAVHHHRIHRGRGFASSSEEQNAENVVVAARAHCARLRCCHGLHALQKHSASRFQVERSRVMFFFLTGFFLFVLGSVVLALCG
jgi:hypothetical protein